MFSIYIFFACVFVVTTNPNLSHCRMNSMVVERVIDGDTIVLLAPMLPAPLDVGGLKLRIMGIDCAETGYRAQCVTEGRLGEEATAFTRSLLMASPNQPNTVPHQVLLCGWDKYGGRVDGDIIIPGIQHIGLRDIPLSTYLLDTKHARPYSGKGPRGGWCNNEPNTSFENYDDDDNTS